MGIDIQAEDMNLSTKNNYIRSIATILMLLSILFVPWWTTALYAVFLVLYFDYYVEVMIAGIIFDSLYAVPLARFYNFTYVATLFAGVIFIAAVYLKKRLTFYTR